MAQTLAPRVETNRQRAAAGPALAPPDRRKRRWSLALVGILVTVGSALAFAVLWMNAGDRVPVLAVAHRVAAGQVITSADVTVVRVSADPTLHPLSADLRDDVVGRTASVDLLPGTLLVREHLASGSLLEDGDAVVGVALRGSQLPTQDLRAGDRVLVVRTAVPSDSEDAGDDDIGRVLTEAIVFEASDEDISTGEVTVSIVVDEERAAAVAGAAAAGLVSLVLIPA